MLLARWNAEEETGAPQESSVRMLQTQTRHSDISTGLYPSLLTVAPFPPVFQMCDRPHHSGHGPADLYGRLHFPDP